MVYLSKKYCRRQERPNDIHDVCFDKTCTTWIGDDLITDYVHTVLHLALWPRFTKLLWVLPNYTMLVGSTCDVREHDDVYRLQNVNFINMKKTRS